MGVANGLDALALSLRALELPPMSEVIVPSNTYIATILAIVQAGLRPVLVEPDIRTYNIDPRLVEAAISSRTKAIMPVHLYGKLSDMEALTAIARERGLFVVEDCAQAHGASFRGRRAGSWGDINAFSFYPTKNLGALGDAGAIVTDSDALAEKARALRNYGSRVKYVNEVVGVNSRLDELQAGFLRIKLRRIEEITERKRHIAAIYAQEIPDTFVKPVQQDGYFDVFHIYNVRHAARDSLREYLLCRGIKTDVHYPVPPHRQECMKGILEGTFPISEKIHSTIVSLPISLATTDQEALEVCRALSGF